MRFLSSQSNRLLIMILPRSGLATKGIVPFDLIKHDLIKSFSLSDWIKDFPDENILNATVASSVDFFCR